VDSKEGEKILQQETELKKRHCHKTGEGNTERKIADRISHSGDSGSHKRQAGNKIGGKSFFGPEGDTQSLLQQEFVHLTTKGSSGKERRRKT